MGDVIRFADFELDRGAYQLRHKGRLVALERIPLDLLFLLVEQPGRLFTREEIQQRVWGKDVFIDSESSINTAVRKLRRALNDDARASRFVIRVPGKGYRFSGIIQGTSRDSVAKVSSNGFVGRAREMSALCAAVEDQIAGSGRLFLIYGEPGIGKTRLAEELSTQAASWGVKVAWGRCWEGGGAPAYWSLIQIIRTCTDGLSGDNLKSLLGDNAAHLGQLVPELLPRLGKSLPPRDGKRASASLEQARFRLFDAVTSLLKNSACIQPLLMIVDDLHEADLPTLQMLRFIARECRGARILIIGTYREAEVRKSPELGKLVGELNREGQSLPIDGLSREEVRQFIESRLGPAADQPLISHLYDATAGNPLFIDGLVRLLATKGKPATLDRLDSTAFRMPGGARQAIHAWLAMLKDRNPLVVAATIGQEFELNCLQRVTQLAGDHLSDMLRDASSIGIVTQVSSSTYKFCHGLIREALGGELQSPEYACIHGKIGQALEDLHRANLEAHLAELAHHFREAGQREKAVDYSIRAGEASCAVFGFEEAVSHWRAALELMTESPEERERRADLLERLGEVLGMSAAEDGEQVHCLEQALELYEKLGRLEAAARVHSRLAAWNMVRGNSNISHALEHNRKAQDFLSESPEGNSSVLFYLGLGTSAFEQMRYDEALAALRRAMDLSEQLGDEIYWVRAASVYAVAHCHGGRMLEAFALFRRLWAKAERLNDLLTSMSAIAGPGYTLILLLDPFEVSALVEHELAKPRTSQVPFMQKTLLHLLGLSRVCMGKLTEAGTLVEQAGQGTPFLEDPLEAQLAFYRGEWRRGDLILAAAMDRELLAGRPTRFCICGHLAAKILRTQGRQAEAESILQKILDLSTNGTATLMEMLTLPELALICVDTGRLHQAHLHLARCREIQIRAEDWRGLAADVARAEAVLAAAERQFDTAQREFEKAMEIQRRYQLPFEQAETFHYWGRALRAAGDHIGAREKFGATIELYHRHDAGESWLERLRLDESHANAPNPIR